MKSTLNNALTIAALVLQLAHAIFSKIERRNFKNRVTEIKADPRGAMFRKFGGVRANSASEEDGVPDPDPKRDDGNG